MFSVNGKPCKYCNHVLAEAMKVYIANNPTLTAAQVVADWTPVQVVSNQVETDVDHQIQRKLHLPTDKDYDKRSREIKLPQGGSVFVSTQFTGAKVQELADRINQQQWGIVIN